MQPVQSIKNQYHGINAHLHSFWQATGTWNRFHNVHITFLLVDLRRALRPLGYTAEIEESLQIRRATGELILSPKPDIAIYASRASRTGTQASAEGVMTAAEFLDVVDTEHPYFAIAIRPMSPDNLTEGEAVTWIELLSPSNKGRKGDALTYLDKRYALAETGIVFVELDYLHETPPTSRTLADYTLNEPGAHPYRIVVIDPRPSVAFGPTKPYEFDVDTSIPTVDIPLNGSDVLTFDFNAAYQNTYENALLGDDLSYTRFPMNFERYSEIDQAKIANRMLAVLRAARDGIELEANAPLPIPEMLPLDAALAAIRALAAEQAE